jgi:Tol biopolymer transport system component
MIGRARSNRAPRNTVPRSAALGLAALIAALSLIGSGPSRPTPPVPPGAASADSLIRPGEGHFEHLWQLTFGGQNAEAYWSQDGRKLTFQSTRDGYPCDQQFVLDLASGKLTRISTGKGRTTCGYFYDHDRRVLFSSTHLASDSCPPTPDYSHGYVWRVDPGYDLFTCTPDGGDLRRLTDSPGYDAETTVSTDGRWLVFTSDRDGDLELYKMHPDGTALTRLTHSPGYDGGAFFSRDGQWICYRASHPADSTELAEYRTLLAQHLVRPTTMNLWVMRSDGTQANRVTYLPGASFAPYFTPDGREIIFASNWENPQSRNFDLYLVGREGGTPRPVTRDPSFDGFPMFSPDGHWLAFSSNRGGRVAGETNLFLARWKP